MLQFEKSFSHVCLGIGRLLSSNILELYRNVKIDGVVLADGVGRNAITVRRPVDALVIEANRVYFLEFVHSWELERSPLFEWVDGLWRSQRIDTAAARLGIDYRLIAWDEVAEEEMRAKTRFPGISGETNEVEARPSLFDSVAIEAIVKRRRIVDWEDLRRDGYTDQAIEHAILLGLIYYPRHDPAFVFFEGDAKSLYSDRSTYLKSLS
ncbi:MULTISPECIES: hypothetical protein [unclassified Caballeronia]|uniref:hypothetical protein n=1 Tax=unclassified Caballeronia TaxID=2646786 RepID=UPI002029929E|nr:MULTISPECIES: hypothetical protein [unclassified Caballeronia]MDR5768091.1 hypothetical protein [Caballeronia sp. LZ028]